MTAADLQLIPESAWIQAVFVILFIGFFGYILKWMSNDKQQTQNFLEKMNSEWQKTVVARDKDWQRWWEIQNDKSNDCMNNVTRILGGVSDNQVKMMNMLEHHDDTLEPRVEKLIIKAEERANGTTKKRARADRSV
jgi:ribulose bisphosphate carboxylase small subunit